MKFLESLGVRLQKVLRLEQRTHYQDRAVLGGLESFIETCAQELSAFQPEIAQRLQKLVRGYALKPPEARRAVVRS